jgi:hypothetical protein
VPGNPERNTKHDRTVSQKGTDERLFGYCVRREGAARVQSSILAVIGARSCLRARGGDYVNASTPRRASMSRQMKRRSKVKSPCPHLGAMRCRRRECAQTAPHWAENSGNAEETAPARPRPAAWPADGRACGGAAPPPPAHAGSATAGRDRDWASVCLSRDQHNLPGARGRGMTMTGSDPRETPGPSRARRSLLLLTNLPRFAQRCCAAPSTGAQSECA